MHRSFLCVQESSWVAKSCHFEQWQNLKLELEHIITFPQSPQDTGSC